MTSCTRHITDQTSHTSATVLLCVALRYTALWCTACSRFAFRFVKCAALRCILFCSVVLVWVSLRWVTLLSILCSAGYCIALRYAALHFLLCFALRLLSMVLLCVWLCFAFVFPLCFLRFFTSLGVAMRCFTLLCHFACVSFLLFVTKPPRLHVAY